MTVGTMEFKVLKAGLDAHHNRYDVEVGLVAAGQFEAQPDMEAWIEAMKVKAQALIESAETVRRLSRANATLTKKLADAGGEPTEPVEPAKKERGRARK